MDLLFMALAVTAAFWIGHLAPRVRRVTQSGGARMKFRVVKLPSGSRVEVTVTGPRYLHAEMMLDETESDDFAHVLLGRAKRFTHITEDQ